MLIVRKKYPSEDSRRRYAKSVIILQRHGARDNQDERMKRIDRKEYPANFAKVSVKHWPVVKEELKIFRNQRNCSK